ncbi:sideroflexin-4 isoform X4 [Meriones unguiculatus]|uniref:sideroflexin-4 isoform X4 n=1 Tax=Meriones unguiculatus TaxID=10047 RepID=UPI000B4F3CC4|nr:sideroflexin-4 isoform X4 [Meriones unguiculatus]XP_021514766.1 sideroflexin-4-like isoform X2 [Meriones unguiculatus]
MLASLRAPMEPNLHFGISERQSFFRRFLQWMDLLDPVNLFISIGSIEKSRQLLFTTEDASKHYLDDKRIKDAWNRSLSSVHPDSSKLIPTLFRPAAFLPVTAPMVVLLMMPATGMKSIVLTQACLYGYTTPFNIINGNASYSHGPVERTVLGAGVFVSSTFLGLIPHLFQMKYPLSNFWLKRALPIAFLVQVSGMNVFASRSFETLRGIEAIRETTFSRAVLFGTSALIPEVFIHFFKRTQFSPQSSFSLMTLRMGCTLFMMGLMVPVSFSMFPQIGQIQYSQLEKTIQSSTEEKELFYNRGV